MLGKRRDEPPPKRTGGFDFHFSGGGIRAAHQAQILADFQRAVRTNDQAATCLRDAEQMAAQAATALVEARKRMRRVTDGVV